MLGIWIEGEGLDEGGGEREEDKGGWGEGIEVIWTLEVTMEGGEQVIVGDWSFSKGGEWV